MTAGQSQDFIEGKRLSKFEINLTAYPAVRIVRSHVQRQMQSTGSAINDHLMTTPRSLGSGEQNNGFPSIPIGNLINISAPEQPLSFFEDFSLSHPWNWLLSDDAGISPAEYPFWNG